MGYLCLFYIKKGIPQKSISSGFKVTLKLSLDQKLQCTSLFSHEVVMANSSFSELLLLMMVDDVIDDAYLCNNTFVSSAYLTCDCLLDRKIQL